MKNKQQRNMRLFAIVLSMVLLFQIFIPSVSIFAEGVNSNPEEDLMEILSNSDDANTLDELGNESKKETKPNKESSIDNQSKKPNSEEINTGVDRQKETSNKSTSKENSANEELDSEIKKSDSKDASNISKVDKKSVKQQNFDLISAESGETLVTDDHTDIIYYQGKPLYTGDDGDLEPAEIDELMKVGITKTIIIEGDVGKVVDLKAHPRISTFSAETFSNEIRGNLNDSIKEGKAKWRRGEYNHNGKKPIIVYLGFVGWGDYGTQTGVYLVNGELAYCFEHSKDSPTSQSSANAPKKIINDRIKRALYYGFGGEGNVLDNGKKGYVLTQQTLSHLYSDDEDDQISENSFIRHDADWKKYWAKVDKGATPYTTISFSNNNKSTYTSKGFQRSETMIFNAFSKNKVTLSIPSGVQLVNLTKKTTSNISKENVTLDAGDKFYLKANLSYGTTYKSGQVKGKMKEYQPFISITENSKIQNVGGVWKKDPIETTQLIVPFKPQEVTLTKNYIDKYTGITFKQDKEDLIIGESYNKCAPNTLTYDGRKMIKKTGCKTGIVKNHDFSLDYYYNSKHKITVNYYDNRTGDKIKKSKSYLKEAGSKYSETHPEIKKGEYTYRYVKHTGNAESGTIGTKNIEINYYYDIPLIKAGLEKIQIYTAPAAKGLPVTIDIMKQANYSYSITDMKDKTIVVNLYKNEQKISGKKYTAKNLPNQLTFTVAPKYLTINETDVYTVKLEAYNPDDFDVSDKHAKITTDGYTSEEKTITIDATNNDVLSYEGIVKTERTVGEQMKVYKEAFDIPITPIKKMKTGYGFEMPINISYTNGIGNADVNFSFQMQVPNDIVDASYIEYKQKDDTTTVPLELMSETTTSDRKSSQQTFALPHVNVEDMTGYLFSDEQVANGDERITRALVDGGRKLYLPIWGHVGAYDVQVVSKEAIGVNLINVDIEHLLDVVGHMYLHMDSETKEKDSIHIEPINKDDPFPNGVPDNWSTEEINQLEEFLEKYN